jgi:thioesterase domain-containing protein
LAEYIEQNRTGALTGLVVGDSRLVLLREKPGSSRHLFFIHDGSGEVDGYIEFCKGLNGDFNCWGVKADPLTDYTPRHLTLAAAAGDYIRSIKKIQPRGPYSIAGWSLGGTIAFEVALQLETMGEEIAFLGLIDASGPREEWRRQGIQFNLESERDWIWDSLPDEDIKEKLENVPEMDHIWPMIVNYLEEKNVSVEKVKKVIPQEYARVIPNYDRLSNREVIYYLNMCRTMANAGAFYIPGAKLKTVLYYFKARQSPGEMMESWRDYCRQTIKPYEIPGDHFSILKNIKADVFEEAV